MEIEAGRTVKCPGSIWRDLPFPGLLGLDRIEIPEDLARLGAFARPDVAALFKDIENPGCPGITKAQAALEKGGARFLLLPHHLDAFLNQFLVFAADFFFLADRGLAVG